VHGTSTRKVDDLVRALGVETGISKSEVSRICAELDGEVAAFRSRSLAHTAFRTCSWTPPTSRPASTGGSSPEQW
jgi:transposase-like protein